MKDEPEGAALASFILQPSSFLLPPWLPALTLPSPGVPGEGTRRRPEVAATIRRWNPAILPASNLTAGGRGVRYGKEILAPGGRLSTTRTTNRSWPHGGRGMAARMGRRRGAGYGLVRRRRWRVCVR